MRRLQEYERFKRAAEDIDALPRMDRDLAVASAFVADRNVIRLPPPVELARTAARAQGRAQARRADGPSRTSSARRSACAIAWARCCAALGDGDFHRFESLFDASEGRLGIVVTFLALLELAKEHLIEIVQEIALAPIYLKSTGRAAADAE